MYSSVAKLAQAASKHNLFFPPSLSEAARGVLSTAAVNVVCENCGSCAGVCEYYSCEKNRKKVDIPGAPAQGWQCAGSPVLDRGLFERGTAVGRICYR